MDILFVLIVCKNEAELRWLPTNATTECVLSDNNNVTIGVLVPCVWVLFINAAKQRFMRAHIFATHTTIDIEVKCARYSIYVQIDTSNAVRQFCLQLIWLCVNESPPFGLGAQRCVTNNRSVYYGNLFNLILKIHVGFSLPAGSCRPVFFSTLWNWAYMRCRANGLKPSSESNFQHHHAKRINGLFFSNHMWLVSSEVFNDYAPL